MTVRPIVIGLVIFYANACLAQMNDYYVVTSGDTLRGTCIRNSISPKRVLFTTNFGTRIDLTPDSTACLVCGKTKLIGANVEVEVSPYLVDEMDTFYTLNLERRNVFLIQSKTGIKQLYWFVDKYKRDQIYIRENNQFVLLRFKRYKWYR